MEGMRFRDRVCLVTGGGSGIGAAVVERLASEGGRVAVLDLAPGDRSDLALECDVTDDGAVRAAVRRVIDEFHRVDVLVSAAGWDRIVRFVDSDPQLWDRVLAVNLRGAISVTHAVLPSMSAHGRGSVVFVASDAGRVGSSGEAVYSAAKGGLIAFGKALAREVARDGIRVNSVAPGPTDTPFLDIFGAESSRILEAMIRQTPLRRLATPADVAAAVCFLASDEAAHITGQTLSVSGGLTMI
ncbi:MAG: 2-hydroxycyclohexanecarboxyl-CoA dehydrogenase [Acidimicrobiia bacterium]|nr:MAG: 2-hydroxycyclohexanecarboxyl-CoA dehydrogenase [Acidimicrobiia bacterium]